MLSLIPLNKDNTHSVLSSLLMEGGLNAIDKISSDVSVTYFYGKFTYIMFLFSLANILVNRKTWQSL